MDSCIGKGQFMRKSLKDGNQISVECKTHFVAMLYFNIEGIDAHFDCLLNFPAF